MIEGAFLRITGSRLFRKIGIRMLDGRATIFMLHRLRLGTSGAGGHSEDELLDVVDTLRRSGAQFARLRDYVDNARRGTAREHTIIFTIDDGFADQGVMAERLIEVGVPSTIFLVSGFLDGEIWPWDDRLEWALRHSDRSTVEVDIFPGGPRVFDISGRPYRGESIVAIRDRLKVISQENVYDVVDRIAAAAGVAIPHTPPENFAPMSWDEVRRLEALGIDFAPHSRTHRIFSRLADDTSRAEIMHSVARVYTETTRKVPLFAWPTGRPEDYSARDIQYLREAGIQGCVAVGADYGWYNPSASNDEAMYSLQRYGLPHRMKRTLQYSTWVERLKQKLR